MSKTLKLDELLKEITPLPWEVPTGIIGRIANSREQVKANRAYEAHAANEFPKLVKALEHQVKYGEELCAEICKDFLPYKRHAPHCPMEFIETAKEALQSATQITIE